jgi:hypothetical protein
MFFDGDQTLGQRTFALTRQSQADTTFPKYRENVRWNLNGVTFITLHITGSNNGLGRTPDGDAEYAERTQANRGWLRRGFEHAKANNSRAIMILTQANLFPEFPPFPGTPQNPSGYTDLRADLQKEAAGFSRPVVLVHGDSHFFRVDKPLSPRPVRGTAVAPALEHFTRVETFGSPYHHWVHVTMDPNDLVYSPSVPDLSLPTSVHSSSVSAAGTAEQAAGADRGSRCSPRPLSVALSGQ